MSLFPHADFADALEAWKHSLLGRNRLAVPAGLKDSLALLETAPYEILSLLPESWDGRRQLTTAVLDTIAFLRGHSIPAFLKEVDQKLIVQHDGAKRVMVTSPLAGAIPAGHAKEVLRKSGGRCAPLREHVAIGIINSGRLAF
jgi:hypothetical protein